MMSDNYFLKIIRAPQNYFSLDPSLERLIYNNLLKFHDNLCAGKEIFIDESITWNFDP